MRILFVTTLAFALVSAAFGCGNDTGSVRTQKIGGCTIETVDIGTALNVADAAPDDAAWIRVSSVEPAEYDLYKIAALDLARALELRGVEIYSCTGLRRVAEGPCWPPYSVELRIELTEQAGVQIQKFLQTTPLAQHVPARERPEGYGPFFVTCGSGSSDWWTVWYRK
jgi:hypothetical protein